MTFSRSFQAEIMRVLAIAGLIMIATAVFGQGGQQPSATPPEFTPAQREAREELNLTAAEYKRGHFADAQQHAERALSLDPSNRTALVFLARIIHQQYKPGINTPENIETARAAIGAYQRILVFESDNEEAFKAAAVLYSQILDTATCFESKHNCAQTCRGLHYSCRQILGLLIQDNRP